MIQGYESGESRTFYHRQTAAVSQNPFIWAKNAGPQRRLEWRVLLFCIAAVVALVGIYVDQRWMTGTAIVLLLGGLSLRFLPASDEDAAAAADDDTE